MRIQCADGPCKGVWVSVSNDEVEHGNVVKIFKPGPVPNVEDFINGSAIDEEVPVFHYKFRVYQNKKWWNDRYMLHYID